MSEKPKKIQISVGTLLLIILIIALLVIIGMLLSYIYGMKEGKNKNNNENSKMPSNLSNTVENIYNDLSGEVIKPEDTLNSNVSNTTNMPTPPENTTNETSTSQNTNTQQPSSTESQTNTETAIDKNSDVAKTALEKVKFDSYAQASLYISGQTDKNNMPNDLILRLGWSKINGDQDKKFNSDYTKQTVTREVLEKSIKSIFGDISYRDESFLNVDVIKFYGYEVNSGEIEYSNGIYTANYIEGGGGDLPFISENLEKVTKTSDGKIKIYVKTAFVDTEYNYDKNDFDYIMYRNFINNEFAAKVFETTATEFSTSSESIFQNLTNQLDTYVYTLDSNYNLISFENASV